MKSIRLFFVVAVIIAALGLSPHAVAAQMFTGYQTGIKVQNLANSEAIITVQYYYNSTNVGGNGALASTANDTIAASSSNTYFPIPIANFTGSVVISSSQPLASIVNLGNTAGSAWGSYVGRSSGSNSAYLPLLHKNNGGYNSWYSIQNTDATTAAQVGINYSDCPNAEDASVIIAPQASVTINQQNETCHTQKGFGATLTSKNSIPVVAVVMQESATSILTYTGFDSGATLPQMPLINMNNSGYHSGIQILNTDATNATDVTVSYTPSQSGTACTETQSIQPGAVGVFGYTAFLSTVAGENCANAVRFIGSAAVTTNSASVPLVAVVNQVRFGGAVSGSYGAFDPAKATNTVKLPIIMDRLGGYNTGFAVANVGTGTAHVKCTFTGTTKEVTSGTSGIAAGQALTHQQNNYFTVSYSGAGTCVAYTDNTFATPNASAKLVAVVNELGSSAGDSLMVYEGINP